MRPPSAATAACLPLSLCLLMAVPAFAGPPRSSTADVLTVVTFNANLNRNALGQLLDDLAMADNVQVSNIAETIQRMNPDIILINESGYDATVTAVGFLRVNYPEVSHNGSRPVFYPYSWLGSVSTDTPSGFDLDGDGGTSGPSDAWGFDRFPGQYGFVVYSKYPIRDGQVCTFQYFLQKNMPGALLPTSSGDIGWYSDEVLDSLSLSSKTHTDLPVDVDGMTTHVLTVHTTSPSSDGTEQRNKKWNFDKIRLWTNYVSNRTDYLYDDNGVRGGLSADIGFATLGDYNSNPLDGDSYPGAIDQPLINSRVADMAPTSLGDQCEAEFRGGTNPTHRTESKHGTGNFNDAPRPGNLHIDYVLSNTGTQVEDAEVFWPACEDEAFHLIGLCSFPTSDHCLVWSKLRFPCSLASSEPSPSASRPETSPLSGEGFRLVNLGTYSGLLGLVVAAGVGGVLLPARHRAQPRSRVWSALADTLGQWLVPQGVSYILGEFTQPR